MQKKITYKELLTLIAKWYFKQCKKAKVYYIDTPFGNNYSGYNDMEFDGDKLKSLDYESPSFSVDYENLEQEEVFDVSIHSQNIKDNLVDGEFELTSPDESGLVKDVDSSYDGVVEGLLVLKDNKWVFDKQNFEKDMIETIKEYSMRYKK